MIATARNIGLMNLSDIRYVCQLARPRSNRALLVSASSKQGIYILYDHCQTLPDPFISMFLCSQLGVVAVTVVVKLGEYMSIPPCNGHTRSLPYIPVLPQPYFSPWSWNLRTRTARTAPCSQRLSTSLPKRKVRSAGIPSLCSDIKCLVIALRTQTDEAIGSVKQLLGCNSPGPVNRFHMR